MLDFARDASVNLFDSVEPDVFRCAVASFAIPPYSLAFRRARASAEALINGRGPVGQGLGTSPRARPATTPAPLRQRPAPM